MTLLRHTAEPGPKERRGGKPRPFRLFEGMRERRYQRIVRDIQASERQLDMLAEKRKTFSLLASSSQASIVNEDESNWDEAMAHAKAYNSSRKALKPESATAAFCLFSQTMFKVAILGGASIVMLHVAVPDVSVTVDLALGAIFTLGTALRTWAAVTTGNEDFLKMVSTALDEQKSSLEAERRRLIKKLHGWKQSD